MALNEETAREIQGIRSVRLAAHELSNVCSAVTGGTEMAVSLPTVSVIGQDARVVEPKGFDEGENDGSRH